MPKSSKAHIEPKKTAKPLVKPMTALDLLKTALGHDAYLLEYTPMNKVTYMPHSAEGCAPFKFNIGHNKIHRHAQLFASWSTAIPSNGIPAVQINVLERDTKKVYSMSIMDVVKNTSIWELDEDFQLVGREVNTLSVLLKLCFIAKGEPMPKDCSYLSGFMHVVKQIGRKYQEKYDSKAFPSRKNVTAQSSSQIQDTTPKLPGVSTPIADQDSVKNAITASKTTPKKVRAGVSKVAPQMSRQALREALTSSSGCKMDNTGKIQAPQTSRQSEPARMNYDDTPSRTRSSNVTTETGQTGNHGSEVAETSSGQDLGAYLSLYKQENDLAGEIAVITEKLSQDKAIETQAKHEVGMLRSHQKVVLDELCAEHTRELARVSLKLHAEHKAKVDEQDAEMAKLTAAHEIQRAELRIESQALIEEQQTKMLARDSVKKELKRKRETCSSDDFEEMFGILALREVKRMKLGSSQGE